jgi:hypothetical protein
MGQERFMSVYRCLGHAVVVTLIIALVAPTPGQTRGVRLSRVDRQEQTFHALVSGRASTRVRRQVLERGVAAIGRVARNPSRVSQSDSDAIGLLSPAQRAQALSQMDGFKVKQVDFARSGGGARVKKTRLVVKDRQRALSILGKVMGPNTLGFLPAKGHSYAVWYDQVVDLYFGDMKPLRASSKPFLPVWLSPKESARLADLYTASISSGFSKVYGTSVAFGKPAPWPLQRLDQRKTANSCTTCFARSVVGARKPAFAWIDGLEAAVAASSAANAIAGSKGLLAGLNGKSAVQVAQTFTRLKTTLPGRARQFDQLRGWVDVHQAKLPAFPLQLMHRQSVAELAGIGGDNPGPGKARQAYRGADSARLPLEIQFDLR